MKGNRGNRTGRSGAGSKPNPLVPAAREQDMANLAKAWQAQITHGAWLWLHRGTLVGCATCCVADTCELAAEGHDQCPPLLELHRGTVDMIMNRAWARDDDLPLAREFARLLVADELIWRWFAAKGMIRDDGTPQPAMKIWLGISNALQRLSDRLGLNPMARHAMGLDKMGEGMDLATLLLDAGQSQTGDSDSEDEER